MTIRLTIDKIKDIHSYINDPAHDEFSGYIYFRNNEVRFIDSKRSEYIDKPPITPKNLFYDYFSFHTHPKKGYNIPSIQDIPSFKDILFVKNTILAGETDGHLLFTPFYVYYITINKEKIKSDEFIKSTYYNTISVSKSPIDIEHNLAFTGVLIKRVKSKGYVEDLYLDTNFVKNNNNYIFSIFILFILLSIIYCVIIF